MTVRRSSCGPTIGEALSKHGRRRPHSGQSVEPRQISDVARPLMRMGTVRRLVRRGRQRDGLLDQTLEQQFPDLALISGAHPR
jgi:hypothetical protein